MKIDDLIRPKIRKFKKHYPDNFWDKRLSGELDDDYDDDDYHNENEGTFSYVIPNKKDPFMIDKKTKYKIGNPGFDKFAEYVLKNQNHNPFLPRIYGVTERKSDMGETSIDYKMEKLMHADDIEYTALDAYLETIFDFEKRGLSVDFYNILDLMYHQKYRFIKSDLLCKTLMDLNKLNRWGLDFGDNNILFRITPHGPQLVLSDPIGYLNKNHKKLVDKYINEN